MSLLKHASAAFTANAVTAAAQYAVVVLVARRLGPQAFGTFVFATTLGGLIAVLPNFGLDRIVQRHVIRERERLAVWFTSAATLRLVLAAGAAALAAALVPRLAPAGSRPAAILLIVVSLIVALGSELCRAVLYACDAVTYELGLRIAGRTLVLGAVIGVVGAGGGLDGVGAALVASGAIEVVLYAVAMVRRVGLRRRAPSWPAMRTLAASAAPIAFNTLFVLLYFRASVLLIAAWAGPVAAGQFGAAFTFVQVLQVASGSLAAVLLPHFVQPSGERVTLGRIDTVTRVLLAGIVPVAAALSLLAPEIVGVVYSSRYAAAAPALAILGWAPVFMFLGSLHGTLLIALDAERTLFWLSLGAALLSLSANAWLIPRYGLMGASWATVGTEAVVGVSCLLLVRRRTGAPHLRPLIWPALLAATLAVGSAATAGSPLAIRAVVTGAALALASVWLRWVAGAAWQDMAAALGLRQRGNA
jgi:O-antigen/teichoic acid export membrane protein